LQVADAAGQPVDPGDHQYVAFTDKVENRLKFGAALGGSTASFLRTNDIATSGFEGCDLYF